MVRSAHSALQRLSDVDDRLFSEAKKLPHLRHVIRLGQEKTPGMLADRHDGERHPLEVGSAAVARYFRIEDECAQGERLRIMAATKGH